MNAELKLGQIINGYAQRDATHVAVAPVMAANMLLPGQRIGLLPDGKASHAAGSIVGIVDPFLTHPVTEGQRFYLWLLPGTVTGMRHEWEHPAFTEPPPPSLNMGMTIPGEQPSKAEIRNSEQWLRAYAARNNPYTTDADEAYQALCEQLRGGELFYHGSDLHSFDEVEEPDLLKEHAERVLGITINWGDMSYSCSC